MLLSCCARCSRHVHPTNVRVAVGKTTHLGAVRGGPRQGRARPAAGRVRRPPPAAAAARLQRAHDAVELLRELGQAGGAGAGGRGRALAGGGLRGGRGLGRPALRGGRHGRLGGGHGHL